MEKKMMIALGVVAIVIVAAVGVALVLGNKGSASTSSSIKILDLQKDSESDTYSPLDKEAVYNGSYPLSRYLYLYTDGVPGSDSSIYKWLNYIYGADGQQRVDDAGFYGLQDSDLQAMLAQLASPTTTGITGDFSESGSTTLGELSLLWAAEFKDDTGITVTITTPGSGTGITNFLNGEADVVQSSRAMKASEKASAASKGIDVIEWKVAVDGLAIIVNADNPVSSLTIAQLEGIYNGTITNWNQVGGNDQSIQLYGREDTSGSYASFKDLVLTHGDDYASSMQSFSSNAQIVPEVESNAGGIGYVGIGYAVDANGTSANVNMVSYQVGAAERSEI